MIIKPIKQLYKKLSIKKEKNIVENRVLVVVDVQEDFVRGVFGSEAARSVVPNICNKIKNFDGKNIFVTMDIHGADYEKSIEGQLLPKHCFALSKGSLIEDTVVNAINTKEIKRGTDYFKNIYKTTFGSLDLAIEMEEYVENNDIDVIEVVGLCTDICVISNVLMLRAACPNTRIVVDADCCVGSTPVNHICALKVMEQNCIEIIGG